jgi:hypothetical protein
VLAEMGFAKKEHEFLAEIGLGPENLGGYVNGAWKATGPVVSSVNPSNNQVFGFGLLFSLIIEAERQIFKESIRFAFL